MRNLLLASAVLLSSGYAAQAADLVIVPDEVPVAAYSSSSIYAQLLGGVALGLDVDFFEDGVNDESYSMDTGFAAAATLGVMVMDNLAIEGDLYFTDRVFTTEPDYDLLTLSAMVNVKAYLPVNEMFTLYGAVGVGVISYSIPPGTDAYLGFGYQLIAGATTEVAENIELVGELRYQSGFGEIPMDNDDFYGIDAPTASALVGLKFSF